MLKKSLLFIMLALFINITASNASSSGRTAVNNPTMNKLYKFKVKTVNEIEYWWVLHNDGCFHLYRVEIVGGLLEFWTPLNYTNYIGTTTTCPYTEQMESLC